MGAMSALAAEAQNYGLVILRVDHNLKRIVVSREEEFSHKEWGGSVCLRHSEDYKTPDEDFVPIDFADKVKSIMGTIWE